MSKLILFVLLGFLFLQVGCGSKSSPTSAGPSSPTYTYPFSFYIGYFDNHGNGNGEFYLPAQLAVYNNALFVADGVNARVMKFDLQGNYLGQAPVTGTPAEPFGLAIDGNGVVYVADNRNDVIDKYDANLDYLGTFSTGVFTLSQVTDLAVDSSNKLYVLDSANERFLQCSGSGTCTAFTGTAAGVGSLGLPIGIAVDGSDNVYIGDTDNGRVLKFNAPGFTSATTVVSGGTGTGQVLNPGALAVDSQGNLLVTDVIGSGGRIQKFTTSGTYLTSLSHPPQGTLGLGGTYGICLDPSGDVYYSDNNREIVDVYKPY
jgi:streptogramin lyase